MDTEQWKMINGRNVSWVCHPSKMVTSSGVWLHNDPLKFAMPLLMLQSLLVTAVTGFIGFLLKPLKFPMVVSQVLGGIILGPSVLGSSEKFNDIVYPSSGNNLMQNVGLISIMYYVFNNGVKSDPTMLVRSGRKEWIIATIGFILPYLVVTSIYTFWGEWLSPQFLRWPFFPCLAMSLSVTTFPTVLSTLTGLNLLNSEITKLAMPVALISSIGEWLNMIMFHLLETTRGGTLLNTRWKFIAYVLSSTALVAFTIWVIRPAAKWVVRKTPVGKPVAQWCVVTFLLGNLVYGLICQMIGGTLVDGSLFFGLVLPDGPPLGSAIVDKSESLMVGGFFPLFFVRVGRNIKMSVLELENLSKWWTWHLMVVGAHLAKLVGTLGSCLYYNMPFRDALSLALIMIFRGPVDIIFYGMLFYGQMIDVELYTILIFWAMILTCIAVTLLRFLYKPSNSWSALTFTGRRRIKISQPNTEIRILACAHSEENVCSIINLLEAICASKKNFFRIYALHLVELVGRFAPKHVAYDKNRKKSKDVNSSDHIVNAFECLEKRNKDWASIQPFSIMAPYNTMQEEICRLALEKSVSLILVPYHKTVLKGGLGGSVDHGLRIVNTKIIAEAPCSIGILVELGLGSISCVSSGSHIHNVAVIFLGGSDDREALIYASFMANNPRINLTLLRLIPLDESGKDEKERELDDKLVERELDDKLVTSFRIKNAREERIVYKEVLVKDGEETITAIRSLGHMYNLLIVGRRREGTNSLLTEGLMDWNERPELGVIGDLIASWDFGVVESILVIQHVEEVERYPTS